VKRAYHRGVLGLLRKTAVVMALRGSEPAVLELPDLMTLENVGRLLGESLSTTWHRRHRGEPGGVRRDHG
jgi:hypothetical protein